MIKLNRTTEYGLMALRHMNRKRGESPVGSHECVVTSAREISDTYGLPFEITAKTLQRLKDTGLIQSAQGARGGYTLRRCLEDVNLSEFLELMEGSQSVVACASPGGPEEVPVDKGCEYRQRCEIKHLMSDLNGRVQKFLSEIRLADLVGHSSHDVTFAVHPMAAQAAVMHASLGDEP
ncbi:MAG: Rrf2 family transcriptional regulator [Oligoflexia bacterium]|nr:Rrf2 family transcriptional regulator [Oligoflexia bacterium]